MGDRPDEAADRALAIKQTFVDDVLRCDSLAERVGRRLEAVVRALAGTNLETRHKVAEWLKTSQPSSRNAIVARGLVLAELAAGSPEPLLAAMAATTDPNELFALVEGLAALRVELSGGQAERAVEPILAAIAATTDSDQLRALGVVLRALVSSSLTESLALQTAIDAMKIPWMAGKPTTLLITAIGERFDEAPQAADGTGYWDVIEWIVASHP